MSAEQSNEKVKPAEVVLRLGNDEAKALLGGAACPALPSAKAKLRAALDSLPVEDTKYRVAGFKDGSDTGTTPNLAYAARLLKVAHENHPDARIQSRTITTFSDGSFLTSPWTDLPSEEGQ